jgi:hypothetical protein
MLIWYIWCTSPPFHERFRYWLGNPPASTGLNRAWKLMMMNIEYLWELGGLGAPGLMINAWLLMSATTCWSHDLGVTVFPNPMSLSKNVAYKGPLRFLSNTLIPTYAEENLRKIWVGLGPVWRKFEEIFENPWGPCLDKNCLNPGGLIQVEKKLDKSFPFAKTYFCSRLTFQIFKLKHGAMLHEYFRAKGEAPISISSLFSASSPIRWLRWMMERR